MHSLKSVGTLVSSATVGYWEAGWRHCALTAPKWSHVLHNIITKPISSTDNEMSHNPGMQCARSSHTIYTLPLTLGFSHYHDKLSELYSLPIAMCVLAPISDHKPSSKRVLQMINQYCWKFLMPVLDFHSADGNIHVPHIAAACGEHSVPLKHNKIDTRNKYWWVSPTWILQMAGYFHDKLLACLVYSYSIRSTGHRIASIRATVDCGTSVRFRCHVLMNAQCRDCAEGSRCLTVWPQSAAALAVRLCPLVPASPFIAWTCGSSLLQWRRRSLL